MRVMRTMAVADKVARRVGALLHGFKRDDGCNQAFLYPYFNCRERGYAVSVENDIPAFLFAENRNSDDIVVYEDPNWSVLSGGLSDEAWENRKYFGYNKVEQAARYIVRRLKKLTREYDREMKKKRKQWAKEEAEDPMCNLGLRA
jgi:hypothetical protein